MLSAWIVRNDSYYSVFYFVFIDKSDKQMNKTLDRIDKSRSLFEFVINISNRIIYENLFNQMKLKH